MTVFQKTITKMLAISFSFLLFSALSFANHLRDRVQWQLHEAEDALNSRPLTNTVLQEASHKLEELLAILNCEQPPGDSYGIEVLWAGPGRSFQALNRDGKKLIPEGWRADGYKVSNRIVALHLGASFYAFNDLGTKLIPDSWKADWYAVNDHFVALKLGDYIYAFNNNGKRITPQDWKGENVELRGDRLKFTWGGTVYLFDREGNRLL